MISRGTHTREEFGCPLLERFAQVGFIIHKVRNEVSVVDRRNEKSYDVMHKRFHNY